MPRAHVGFRCVPLRTRDPRLHGDNASTSTVICLLLRKARLRLSSHCSGCRLRAVTTQGAASGTAKRRLAGPLLCVPAGASASASLICPWSRTPQGIMDVSLAIASSVAVFSHAGAARCCGAAGGSLNFFIGKAVGGRTRMRNP